MMANYGKFTVEQGKSYEARIKLTGVEAWASNDMIVAKFEELGFINVHVSGSGGSRNATGTWPLQTTTVDMPPQVVHAEAVQLVYDDDSKKKSSDSGDDTDESEEPATPLPAEPPEPVTEPPMATESTSNSDHEETLEENEAAHYDEAGNIIQRHLKGTE